MDPYRDLLVWADFPFHEGQVFIVIDIIYKGHGLKVTEGSRQGKTVLAELCDATTEGVAVGSQEFSFRPGRTLRGGHHHWDIDPRTRMKLSA